MHIFPYGETLFLTLVRCFRALATIAKEKILDYGVIFSELVDQKAVVYI